MEIKVILCDVCGKYLSEREWVRTVHASDSNTAKHFCSEGCFAIWHTPGHNKNGPVKQTSLPDGSPSPHVPHPGLGAPQ
jgi:hypothetical protein